MTNHATWLPDPDTLDAAGKERLRAAILKGLRPLRLPVRTMIPQPKQEAFLRANATQKFYGGAAGGGKSFTLMIGASQYVDVPKYSALLLRRTYPELALPGGLIDIGHEMFDGTQARWNQSERTWRWPNGATITFSYLRNESDKFRYKSARFQYIGFDELTHFSRTQYTYLFSRLRRPANGPLSRVPLTMASGSNPGGPYHDWVRSDFVVPSTRQPDAIYMPARVQDNREIDVAEYIRMLGHLPSVEIDRLLRGDWDAQESGERFWATWFHLVDSIAWRDSDGIGGILTAPPVVQRVRAWDFAATEPSIANPDPDWTVGTLMARHSDNTFTVEDVVRARVGPAGLEQILAATAHRDGRGVSIRIPQDPGAAGKAWAHVTARQVLTGYDVVLELPVQSKDVRARPLASAAQRGLVFMVRAPWNQPMLDELQRFDPRLKNQVDDQVDSVASAYTGLVTRGGPASITMPSGSIM